MIPMTKICLSTINKNPEVYRLQSRLLTNLQNLLASVSFDLETNCQVDLDSLDKTGMFSLPLAPGLSGLRFDRVFLPWRRWISFF